MIQVKKEGYGEILFKNGDKYIGNWKNNKKEGEGKIIKIKIIY